MRFAVRRLAEMSGSPRRFQFRNGFLLIMPSFRGKNFTDEKLRALPRLEKIKRLELVKTAVTDDGIQALEAAESLEEICIDSDHISNVSIEVLSQLPALVSLMIYSAPRIDDKGLRYLSKCTRLHELYLDSTSITDRGLKHIGELPEVWSLSLDHTSITDKGCAALKGLKKLKLLTLDHTLVTGAEIGGFLEPEFFDVYLEHSQATDAGILALAQNQPNLRTISLIGTQVGDRTAAALAKLPRIEDVRLSETNITDQALQSFGACRSLYELYLEGTVVSPQAVKALKKTSRKLTIYEPGWRQNL